MPSPVAACSADTAAAAQVNTMAQLRDQCEQPRNDELYGDARERNARGTCRQAVRPALTDSAQAISGMTSKPHRLCSISAMARPRLARSVNLALRIAGG
jgi:hypothetical protein